LVKALRKTRNSGFSASFIGRKFCIPKIGPRRDQLEGNLIKRVSTKAINADLLLVDGNPLEELKAVTNSDNIRVIMKDGVIFKNTLD
jgi:hypothetical protein